MRLQKALSLGIGCTIFFLAITVFAGPEVVEEIRPRDIHSIPDGFPQFEVPGMESEVNTVRQMFYHHYLFYPGPTYNDVYLMKSLAWADTGEDPRFHEFRRGIRKLLSNRRMTPDGYVSSMQHIGLAHPEGWPFPLWTQSEGTGWHFAERNPYEGLGLDTEQTEDIGDWIFDGIDHRTQANGLHIELASDRAVLTSPEFEAKGIITPFITLHWQLENVPEDAVFYLDWITEKNPEYTQKQRSYFSVKQQSGTLHTAVPLYPMLDVQDTLTQIRLNILGAEGANITIARTFTSVDSRHRVNNLVWIQGSTDYLRWTGDLNFLRTQMNRWRKALRYAIDEFQVESYKCINSPWVGHDGRPGRGFDEEGNRVVYYGKGMGGGYFDLIPHGGKDAAATLFLYDCLKRMAALEEQVAAHPQWNIPGGPMRLDPAYLRGLAEKIKEQAKSIFWNPETERFVVGVDRDGKIYDYGWVYHNLETIYYGLASNEQAKKVYEWIDGDRIIDTDTSKGDDIYYWRFAPRMSTKRNVNYCKYSWEPLVFEWGDQVQDGGGVLAWSYYDIMNRLELFGPENAWNRLQEIIEWFDEVQEKGGYREYYAKTEKGTLQGGGTAGGLGLDSEFLENIMVPQVMIYGFMGLNPRLDAIEIKPSLPSDWPELTVTSIRWHGKLLDITVKDEQILINVREGQTEKLRVIVPDNWSLKVISNSAEKAEKNE